MYARIVDIFPNKIKGDKMQNPIISVIVPVYNVRDYLKKCLDSILSQTFSDFELICVNDGSTDGSRKILEEYKKRDNRIIIVDKENGGLSSARNEGMKAAKGKFFSFIDSDDWVDKTMLEKLYKSIDDNNSDIAICAVHQFDENKQQIDDSNPYYTLEFFDKTFDNRAFSYKDTKPFIMDVCVMAWNKLYRRSLIEQCSAKFPEGLIFEDGPFFFSIFFKTQRISIVRDFLYYYRINRKNSIIQKAGKKFIDVIDVTEMMFNKIKDLEDFDEFKYTFFRKKVEDFIYRFEHLNQRCKKDFVNKLRTDSSLIDDTIFPSELVRGKFCYNYFLFKNLVKYNFAFSELMKYKIKAMYKLMEILYREEGVYTLKYKKLILRFKKYPKILDIYYKNDRIYVRILKKIKFDFTFKYSKLEKFNEDD